MLYDGIVDSGRAAYHEILCQMTRTYDLSQYDLLISAMTTHLKDKMSKSSLIMQLLNNMMTKALRIAGLYTVRTVAIISFRQLEDEEKRIQCIFSYMNQYRQQSGSVHIYKE